VFDKLITDIQAAMAKVLNTSQLNELERVLVYHLNNTSNEENAMAEVAEKPDNDALLLLFLAAKRIEGCSEKSLRYYDSTIKTMLTNIAKPTRIIETEDLRLYLGNYQKTRGSSKVTIDNIRRIFSSFFGWLEDEDYIFKSPVRRIRKIKTDRPIRETLSDEGLERLRDACTSIRDLALVDLLASTGIRVGELVGLNRNDVNLNERECVVVGKGGKERLVYFDARAKVHLAEYLGTRTDDEPALFTALARRTDRLQIGGVETRLRLLGERADVHRVHPHKFRRTLATRAIDKGMPIEQVQRLLGHARIDTTMQYAMVNQANVKNSHRKYIG